MRHIRLLLFACLLGILSAAHTAEREEFPCGLWRETWGQHSGTATFASSHRYSCDWPSLKKRYEGWWAWRG